MIMQHKNIDDRNCLKPVFTQNVVSKVNISSKISPTEGAINWEEGEGGSYVFVCITILFFANNDMSWPS